MALKFNDKTSIVDVIFKNPDNPSGVNLKHLKFNNTIVWHKNLTASITPPTCTVQGYTTYSCLDCGETYIDKDSYVEAWGHQYGKAITTVPTCTTKGKTTRTCGVCGDIEVTNVTPALGHNTGDWEVTIQPTVSSTGKKVKKCGRCNKVIESETIPKLDFIAPALSATATTGRYDTVKLTIKNNNSFAVSYQVVPSFRGKNSPVHQNLTGTLAANGSVALQLVPANLDGIDTTFLRATLLVIFTVNGVSINNETTVYGSEGVLSIGQNSVSFYGINQYACPILSCYAYNPNDVAVTCYVSIFDNYGSAYETAAFEIAAKDYAFYEYDCGQSELDGGTYEMYFSADGYADSDTMTGSIS